MRFKFIVIIFFVLVNHLSAQDSSLLKMLNDSLKTSVNQPTSSTFKASHIVNMQTIESPSKGDLNLIIMHRFGKINDGSYNFFGLDNATLRLGLDYGISNRVGIGIGRSSLDKTFDGYLKYRILSQTESGTIPVSISALGSITNYTLKFSDKPYLNARYRTSYVVQALVARKFSETFSLQLSPTWIHFNMVATARDKNDVYAASIGGRWKFTKRMGITAEYNYLLPNQVKSIPVKNSISCGLDIETGGHVFQLVFTNSQGMTEPQYIAKSTGSWGHGDIYFGFNVSRNFSFGKNKKSRSY
ncbi:MAG: DUF5777 family beta-barrel protein [Flavitalea sp.]